MNLLEILFRNFRKTMTNKKYLKSQEISRLITYKERRHRKVIETKNKISRSKREITMLNFCHQMKKLTQIPLLWLWFRDLHLQGSHLSLDL